MISEETWYEFYTPENLKLLRAIRETEFGEIKIEIHHKRPVYLYIWKKMRLKSNETNNRKLPIISQK